MARGDLLPRAARPAIARLRSSSHSLHQAQLEALRSQLNPHFLFNTLHSIAELVHSNPRLAEQLIVRLGELLRQVLQTSSRQELTLAEELDFIRGYVEIEQMRLGERLRVIWDIQPEALESRVPSLILQPLVENAIQHGIAASEGTGTLTIRARRVDGQLQVEVADTGPGLTPRASRQTPGHRSGEHAGPSAAPVRRAAELRPEKW